MSTPNRAYTLLLHGCVAGSLFAIGCSSDDSSEGIDGSLASADADPNAPDADPNAPDADPNAPDADPNAPDADPNAPDADTSAPDADTAPDANTSTPDATPSAPDATPGAPDATPSAPDATPSAPDATPSAPDATPSPPDATPSPPDATTVTGCSAEAIELIGAVNDYRDDNGLPAIAASPSLCFVGDTHVDDLIDNSPDAPAMCNSHSWSDQGSWTACCYTADHAQAQCMWDKPKELTTYPSNGYENSASSGGTITPSQALSLWQNSSAHNDVILNQGIWSGSTWRALGAGFRDGRAVLWFGTSVDPAN